MTKKIIYVNEKGNLRITEMQGNFSKFSLEKKSWILVPRWKTVAMPEKKTVELLVKHYKMKETDEVIL